MGDGTSENAAGQYHIIIEEILASEPVKLVFSNPGKRQEQTAATDNPNVIRVVIRLIEMKQGQGYQIEKFTKTQVFHINITKADLENVMEIFMAQFRQLNVWCETMEIDVKQSKKGKLLVNRRRAVHAAEAVSHNKKKHYLLAEGTPIPPLVDLGVFTKDGRVVHAMYDKYKQINRFLEMVEDVLKDYPHQKLNIIDFGCGKSYLTFVLYYYLTEEKGYQVTMTGLDLKQGVIDKCNETANKYQYEGLHFELGDINGYHTEQPVDIVITLHACDTATDYALYNAVQWKANIILSVPCCQHELNQQIRTEKFGALTKYGIIKERTAALMTDAIRGSLLEYCGYRTQLLEFIDISHSPKNIMIRAVRGNVSPEKRRQALAEVERLCEAFSLAPTLCRLLLPQNGHDSDDGGIS
ncbi:MAG: SAM-dependent methyltransferase [Lachnospiraceae bacterium]|nr:SAM-dependent methyltransferase [Lachnospiraceae bacterium]